MDDRIDSARAAAFPDRTVADVAPSGPSWNDANETVVVTFADGDRAYLKTASDGDGTRIARERAVVEYVAATRDLPVPTILAWESDAEVPYLATAPVPGRNLLDAWSGGDEDERATLARRVGRTLADLHAVRFENHGRVTGGGRDGLELEAGSWTDVLLETIARTRERAGAERFDHYFEAVMAGVEATRDSLDDAPAALLHGDPARPNCFLAEEGLGLLDWEIAHVGDPVREIRRTRRQQLEPLRGTGSDRIVAAFHEGYRERAGGLPDGFEERGPVYDAVTFLGTAGFFGKWAPDADEPTEELAAWVREEMDGRLDDL